METPRIHNKTAAMLLGIGAAGYAVTWALWSYESDKTDDAAAAKNIPQSCIAAIRLDPTDSCSALPDTKVEQAGDMVAAEHDASKVLYGFDTLVTAAGLLMVVTGSTSIPNGHTRIAEQLIRQES